VYAVRIPKRFYLQLLDIPTTSLFRYMGLPMYQPTQARITNVICSHSLVQWAAHQQLSSLASVPLTELPNLALVSALWEFSDQI
jgi:hypothetical protein